MNPRTLLFLATSLFFQTVPAQQPHLKATAESVLDKLYQVNGNKIYPKPAIEIVAETRNAAQFVRRTNTILVGIKTFEVCRVFGKDSLSALAFVIGHEMAHAFQLNAKQTSFLAYDKMKEADPAAEKDADIQGLFNAWLAGYQAAELLPYLIEGVYVVYDLKGKNLPDYPTLEERKRAAGELRLAASELIRMYETAQYLTAVGQYELAVACLLNVENRYKGREIYNNLGINLLLQAMHISEKNVDPYVFPFELDCDARLKKPQAERGGSDISPEQWSQRGHLLAKAAEYFSLAAKMDYEHLPAEINYLCAMVLNNKAAEAIQYAEGRELAKKGKLLDSPLVEQEKVKLALGLAYAYNARSQEAAALFDELKNSTDDFVQYASRHNSDVIWGKTPAIAEASICSISFDTDALVDGVKPQLPETGAWVLLDPAAQIEISTVVKTNSEVDVFRVGGQNRVSLQRIRTPAPPPEPVSAPRGNVVATNRGHIEVCRDKRAAALVNEARKKTMEWVKYHEF